MGKERVTNPQESLGERLGHLPSWRLVDIVSLPAVFIENYQRTLQPQLYVLTLISHSDGLSLHKKTLSF